jgi:predicted ATPase
MAHDVFISYSSKDKSTTDAICAILEKHYIRCWIAPRDILPGKDWGESIIEALESTKILILILSSSSNKSTPVLSEVISAISKGIPIITVRIEDVQPSKSLELHLVSQQWLDLFTLPSKTSLNYLVDTIISQLKNISTNVKASNQSTLTEQLINTPIYKHSVELIVPTNLTEQLTSFIGRDSDVKDICTLIHSSNTRMLTMVGPGGIGKTRLSIEAAIKCKDVFPDGVWLVELENIRHPSDIPLAICSALNISLTPDKSPEIQLQELLVNQKMLIICDNFEQLIDGGGILLSRILQKASQLVFMVTSRHPLEVRGERIYQVKPLIIPSENATPYELEQSDCGQLFVARAKDAWTNWSITAENSPLIALICIRLEGIPLCIELVAARIQDMTLHQMLDGLQDCFKLLTSRNRDLPERQRTMYAAIKWSYELLSAEIQLFFNSISIFCGGFTLEAAKIVTGSANTHDHLITLHRHSLLQIEQKDERIRYNMLDVLREYALSLFNIENVDLINQIRLRHATYYTELAENCNSSFRSPSEIEAMTQLSDEIENCRLAWTWVIKHDNLLTARLSLALHHILVRLGAWEEIRKITKDGLIAAQQAEIPAMEAALLLQDASLAHDIGNKELSISLLTQANDFFLELNDIIGQARVANLFGILAQDDDVIASERYHLLALKLRRQINNITEEAISLHNLGLLAQKCGELVKATDYYQESLTLRRQVNDKSGIAETSCNLGIIAQGDKRIDDACACYLECLPIWLSLKDEPNTAIILCNLGEIFAIEKPAYAASLIATALHIFRRIGSPHIAYANDLLSMLCSTHNLNLTTIHNLSQEEMSNIKNVII